MKNEIKKEGKKTMNFKKLVYLNNLFSFILRRIYIIFKHQSSCAQSSSLLQLASLPPQSLLQLLALPVEQTQFLELEQAL
jgi:hypothetical protein